MKQLISPVLLTLYTLVAEHQPIDREELAARLARQPKENLVDKFGVAINTHMEWVSKALYYLRNTGWVRREGQAYGQSLWVAVPQAEVQAVPREVTAAKAGAPAKPRRRPAKVTYEPVGPVVQPRRVDMFGPVYRPTPVATRTGARDYENLPSLHQGKRYAWRSGLTAPG